MNSNKYNVPDVKLENGTWVKSYTTYDGAVQVCNHTRASTLWNNMKARCKQAGSVNGFNNFQEFAEWCQGEHGYLNKDKNGKFWHLDKDILIIGNKIYSKDTCCFIPSRVNTLLLSVKARRGDYPLGVYYHKGIGKFHASVSGGRLVGHTSLGLYHDPIEAHRASRKASRKPTG